MLKTVCKALSLILLYTHVVLGNSKLAFLTEPYKVPYEAFYNIDNKRISLEDFENKTLLLVFWATWCAECIKYMKNLDILQRDFRKLPFEIIAVSEDFGGIDLVKNFFNNYEIRNLKIYYDKNNQLFKALNVAGLPSSFVISPESRVIMEITGPVNLHDEKFRAQLLFYIDTNGHNPNNSFKEQLLDVELIPQKNSRKIAPKK